MPLTEMTTPGQGGGDGVKIEIGTVTVTTGSQTFAWQKLTQKPTRFFMYRLTSPLANGNMVHIIDENVAPSAQWYAYYSGSSGFGEASYPTTTNDYIQDIDSSGFTLKTSSNAWIGDYAYIAIVE